MAISFELEAETRTDLGKGASRRLRHRGLVPAVIYGAGGEPRSLQIAQNKLLRHLDDEAFYSHVLVVKIDGKAEQAVLKDLQRHPSKPIILHMDLLRVSATEKLRMNVPLHFVGAETSPAVKLGGGVVSHNMVDVEVSCLAKDLPEFIEVDMSSMEIGQSLHLTDLVMPDGVEIVVLAQGTDHDQPIAAIHAPRGGGDEDEGEAVEGGEAESDSEE